MPLQLPRALGLRLIALAAVYTVFFLATVFWKTPTTAAAAVVSGCFSAALGLVLLLVSRSLRGAGVAGALVAGLAVVVGVTQMILRSDLALSVLAGLLWVIVGAVCLWFSAAVRRAVSRDDVGENAARPGDDAARPGEVRSAAVRPRDWLLSALVSLGTGVWLVFTRELGAHGQLGIAGGSAIVLGVFWGVAAATLILDSAGNPDAGEKNRDAGEDRAVPELS